MAPASDAAVGIRARAAFFEPLRPGATYLQRGRQVRSKADVALAAGERQEAERIYRSALEHLVDAFLVARDECASAFDEAHELGAFIASTFGCRFRSDDGGEYWYTGCPIVGLHAPYASSIGGITRGRCSICGRPDFECSHVPGAHYNGELCLREVYEVDLREVSLVTNPEDPRCFRTEVMASREDIERSLGGTLPSGAVPQCEHCLICAGAQEKTH